MAKYKEVIITRNLTLEQLLERVPGKAREDVGNFFMVPDIIQEMWKRLGYSEYKKIYKAIERWANQAIEKPWCDDDEMDGPWCRLSTGYCLTEDQREDFIWDFLSAQPEKYDKNYHEVMADILFSE